MKPLQLTDAIHTCAGREGVPKAAGRQRWVRFADGWLGCCDQELTAEDLPLTSPAVVQLCQEDREEGARQGRSAVVQGCWPGLQDAQGSNRG